MSTQSTIQSAIDKTNAGVFAAFPLATISDAIAGIHENNENNDAQYGDWNDANHVCDTYELDYSIQQRVLLNTVLAIAKSLEHQGVDCGAITHAFRAAMAGYTENWTVNP